MGPSLFPCGAGRGVGWLQRWKGCWEEPWWWTDAGAKLCSSTNVSGTGSTHRPDAVPTEKACVCVCGGCPTEGATAQGAQRTQGCLVPTQGSHLLAPSSSRGNLPRSLRVTMGWGPVLSPCRSFPLELPAPPTGDVGWGGRGQSLHEAWVWGQRPLCGGTKGRGGQFRGRLAATSPHP